MHGLTVDALIIQAVNHVFRLPGWEAHRDRPRGYQAADGVGVLEHSPRGNRHSRHRIFRHLFAPSFPTGAHRFD